MPFSEGKNVQVSEGQKCAGLRGQKCAGLRCQKCAGLRGQKCAHFPPILVGANFGINMKYGPDRTTIVDFRADLNAVFRRGKCAGLRRGKCAAQKAPMWGLRCDPGAIQ